MRPTPVFVTWWPYKYDISLWLHPDFVLRKAREVFQTLNPPHFTRLGKLSKACSKRHQLVASKVCRILQDGLANVVYPIAMKTKYVRLVRTFQKPSNVFSDKGHKLFEKCFCLLVSERSHGIFFIYLRERLLKQKNNIKELASERKRRRVRAKTLLGSFKSLFAFFSKYIRISANDATLRACSQCIRPRAPALRRATMRPNTTLDCNSRTFIQERRQHAHTKSRYITTIYFLSKN